jgi:hypothetical protein
MTDIEVDFEDETEAVEIEADDEAGDGEAAEGEEKKATKKKDPEPEGWSTPAKMVKVLRERGIVDDSFTPQQMFGFVKNGKDFPKNEDGSPYLHTDGRYIVPIEDTLLIEARVSPRDVAFIRPELPATVKVTAYDYAIYGALEGAVEARTVVVLAHPGEGPGGGGGGEGGGGGPPPPAAARAAGRGPGPGWAR